MKNSPHRQKHQQRKAIRASQKEGYPSDKKALTELDTTTQIKVKSKKQSHMTSPADVTWATEPEIIHQEGEHWLKTIQKQTLDTAGRLQKKLGKIKLFRKKK